MEVEFVLGTRLAYAGSRCTLLSFWPDDGGVRIQIDRWPENGNPYLVDEFVISLTEFEQMTVGLRTAGDVGVATATRMFSVVDDENSGG